MTVLPPEETPSHREKTAPQEQPPASRTPSFPPPGWPTMRGALAKELVVSGRGLHTGRKVTARLRPVNPEAAGQGVLFRRVRHGKMLGVIPATLRAWRKLPLCSTLEGENGLQVRTVEHLLAALLICGIDDVTVDLDNEEVPILDGGAEAWILGIRGVGRTSLPVTRRFILSAIQGVTVLPLPRFIPWMSNLLCTTSPPWPGAMRSIPKLLPPRWPRPVLTGTSNGFFPRFCTAFFPKRR